MFKLNYKVGEKLNFDSLAVGVFYIPDDKKINNNLALFEKKFRFKLSDLQKKNLLAKKNKQITISNAKGKPAQIYLHKFKLDEKFTVDYFRNHLAGLIKELNNEQLKSLHIFIPNFDTFRNTSIL